MPLFYVWLTSPGNSAANAKFIKQLKLLNTN